MNIKYYLICLFSLSNLFGGPLLWRLNDLRWHIEGGKVECVYEDIQHITKILDHDSDSYGKTKKNLEKGMYKRCLSSINSSNNNLYLSQLLFIAATNRLNSDTPPGFHESLLENYPGIVDKFRDLQSVLLNFRIDGIMSEDDYKRFCDIMVGYWHIPISQKITATDFMGLINLLSKPILRSGQINPCVEALKELAERLDKDEGNYLIKEVLFKTMGFKGIYSTPNDSLFYVLSGIKYPDLSALVKFYRALIFNGVHEEIPDPEFYSDGLLHILIEGEISRHFMASKKASNIVELKSKASAFIANLANKVLIELLRRDDKESMFNLMRNLSRIMAKIQKKYCYLKSDCSILANIFDPLWEINPKIWSKDIEVISSFILQLTSDYKSNHDLQGLAQKLAKKLANIQKKMAVVKAVPKAVKKKLASEPLPPGLVLTYS